MTKMLIYDPKKRWRIIDCLKHPLLREFTTKQTTEAMSDILAHLDVVFDPRDYTYDGYLGAGRDSHTCTCHSFIFFSLSVLVRTGAFSDVYRIRDDEDHSYCLKIYKDS